MASELAADVYQPRSEEDQIRRSVFSRCLRRLASAGEAERIAWGIEVQRIIHTESAKKDKNQKRPRDAEPANHAEQSDGAVVFADEVATIEDFHKLTTPSENTNAVSIGEAQQLPPPLTAGSATEAVAAYMRQLLDRVVGLSLNVLSSPALGFLCVMLGISSKPPKGKDALYSILANFHYQECEKIGKRQVSNKTVLLHAQQDAAALAKAGMTKRAVPPKKADPPVVKPKQQKQTRGDTQGSVRCGHADVPSSDDDEMLSVVESKQLFSKTSRKPLHTGHRETAVASSNVLLLDEATLQRRVLTLVQVLDPVTTDTLHKKVNDGGASADRQRIEKALATLAGQGVLFYENGIAYFAG